MSDPPPITAAQETITNAILAALILCTIASYTLLTNEIITSFTGYTALFLANLLTTMYFVPNLTAYWLGRPLEHIMDDTITVEHALDTLERTE